ncbi:MAG: hypothetical protein ACTHU1_01000 [Arachnia sp.]
MTEAFRVHLEVGATIFTNRGRTVVSALQRGGVEVSVGGSDSTFIAYADLEAIEVSGNGVSVRHRALSPWWEALSQDVRDEALRRQEIVLELLTGYRSGCEGLAQEGEPFAPFDPSCRVSESQRRQVMAARLARENIHITAKTLYNWIRAWEVDGLRGLVDGRRSKSVTNFDGLLPRYMALVDEEVASFDGGASAVSASESRRRVWRRMEEEGLSRDAVPQRLAEEYLRYARKGIGPNTRAHRTSKVRQRAGFGSSTLLHPSHLCIDVTRADNLVWDEIAAQPLSVEIITVLSVSTRVVLACRVVPRSATALEAGLVMYDAMRPFSMLVEGTTIDDWRWAGLPHSLSVPLPAGYTNTSKQLQGHHWIPSVRPTSLRSDHGANFVADHFLALLRDFGIDFLPSRVGAPTDNAFIERWHETLQRGLQQIPGYKGRNVQQRGRFVASEPLLTVWQLERHLHRFIALDYHRTWHEGLALPTLERARFTPLEYFDIVLEAAGRIDVPQHPDLLYQFLPVVWLTPNGAGIEYRNLSYDGPVLREFRNVRRGLFQPGTSKVPFHYDPRDVSRLWFRHPNTDRVHEIRWRSADLLDAPLTDRTLTRAIKILKERGGNAALTKTTATHQIIDALGELSTAPGTDEAVRIRAVDRLRWEAAQQDHDDVSEATSLLPEQAVVEFNDGKYDEPWPDYDQQGA